MLTNYGLCIEFSWLGFLYLQFFMRLLRLRQVADQSPTTERIQNFLCGRMYFQARICRELLTVFVGPDFDNFDEVCKNLFNIELLLTYWG